MITKLGMVILLEHNVDKAVEFYKKLGLKQIFHIKESWAEFALGSVKIGLCPTSQEVHERITGVVLEVEDVKKFYEQYKDEIPFKSEPIEKVHGIMASIIDPGGNIIDLYQPTPEKVQQMVKQVVQKDTEENSSKSKGCCEGKMPSRDSGCCQKNSDKKGGCRCNDAKA